MRWTTEPPTEVGWYWRRDTRSMQNEPQVSRVFLNEFGRPRYIHAGDYCWTGTYKLEWAGPIPEPEE